MVVIAVTGGATISGGLDSRRAARRVHASVRARDDLRAPVVVCMLTRCPACTPAVDGLVTDATGQSRIAAEDYAVALLDEVETPRFIRQRFTVAH